MVYFVQNLRLSARFQDSFFVLIYFLYFFNIWPGAPFPDFVNQFFINFVVNEFSLLYCNLDYSCTKKFQGIWLVKFCLGGISLLLKTYGKVNWNVQFLFLTCLVHLMRNEQIYSLFNSKRGFFFSLSAFVLKLSKNTVINDIVIIALRFAPVDCMCQMSFFLCLSV